MAKGDASDLLMMFVKGGNPLKGESSTVLDFSDRGLLSGFKKGYIFEIDSFTLKAGLDGNDDEEEAGGKKKGKKDADGKKKKTSIGQFKKWRTEGKSDYPVDMPPIEFKRAIDSASTTLMDDCIHRNIYDSATLIKRKAAGGAASGEVFLRFDFTSVLIIRIDVDNDEPIKENYQFICRGLSMFYKPQLPNGTLGAIKSTFWTVAPDVKPVTLV